MTTDHERGMEAAIGWHVRLRDGDDRTWDAFQEWLGADPRHPGWYDEIERIDEALEPLLPELRERTGGGGPVPAGRPLPANDDEAGERRFTFRRWLAPAAGMAAAAAVAFLVVGPRETQDRIVFATQAGEQRVVRVGGGTEIALNGATRLLVDRDDARSVELVEGQALFRVRHDERHPLVIAMGDARVTDFGTTFDVIRRGEDVRVAVAEGEVRYEAGGDAVSLLPGQALLASAGGAKPRVVRAPADSVGAWRDGRLVYAGASLSQVAQDLGRSLGIEIAVAPELRDRPFSGSIVLRGRGSEELRRLQAVLGVAFDGAGNAWTMTPGTRVSK